MLRSMCDLPGSGIEPVSSALAGGFFTTEPPVKYYFTYFNFLDIVIKFVYFINIGTI